MITHSLNAPLRLPLWAHGAAAVLAFGAFQGAKALLDASYAASRHPVDYATGQTSFDATQIEGWYGTMQSLGTLDLYVRTQLIDFGFIASVMLVGLMLGTLVARLGRADSWGRKIGLAAAAFAIAGASMDAIENLLSFIMLSTPEAIPQMLAVIYSGAAVIKFALLTTAMAALLLSLGFGFSSRVRG